MTLLYSIFMTIDYIIAPLVGAVIGYITNDIAIRMLFRPHTAKYIFGIHVPFTPGIIPKERGRIASSVGEAISENLMNKEVLEKTLLSEDMVGKLSDSINAFFQRQRHNSETLREFLSHYISTEEIDSIAASIGANLTQQIYRKLADSTVGSQIAHIAVRHVMDKMNNFGSTIGDTLKDEGIGQGGGFGRMIGRGFERLFGSHAKRSADEFVAALASPVEEALAKNINEMLKNNSEEIVGNLITTQTNDLLSCKMSELLKDKTAQINQARQSILSLYRNIITNRLPRILETLNISGIIENRILEMDMDESERLILEVMKKELRAIVWLGAGLGFIMGFLNVLL